MAVNNLLSGPITNRDASPRVAVDAHVMQGRVRSAVGTLECVSGDDIASTYRFFELPSNCRVITLELHSDDIGATTIADFGIYQTTANGSAVVDADFFASAVSLKDGALSAVDITHESAVFGLEDAEKQLFDALGIAADPLINYDVVATLTAAADAAATITLKCLYVV